MIHAVLKQKGDKWLFRPVGCANTEMSLLEALVFATKQAQDAAKNKEIYVLEVLPEGAKSGHYCQTLKQVEGALKQMKK